MKKLIATAVAAVAFAVTVPVALAQTTPGSDTSPPVTAPRGVETGPGMMYGQGQGQGQTPAQGGTGPGMTYGQGQGSYGSGMMNGYGVGWMGGYGGIWVVILLVIVVGAVTWIVTQRRK